MKMFGLNGLFGLLIAVVLVVALAIILGFYGVKAQQQEATHFYTLDKNAIKMIDTNNASYYKLEKEQR